MMTAHLTSFADFFIEAKYIQQNLIHLSFDRVGINHGTASRAGVCVIGNDHMIIN